MKTTLRLLLFCVFIVTVHADTVDVTQQQKMKKVDYAQMIFRKKLQRKCGYTAGHWAQQHTLVEWKMIAKDGGFKNEFATMCPRGVKVLKDKWIEPLYLFAKEYAKDTGNRPRC